MYIFQQWQTDTLKHEFCWIAALYNSFSSKIKIENCVVGLGSDMYNCSSGTLEERAEESWVHSNTTT